jgi:hypothetical protein
LGGRLKLLSTTGRITVGNGGRRYSTMKAKPSFITTGPDFIVLCTCSLLKVSLECNKRACTIRTTPKQWKKLSSRINGRNTQLKKKTPVYSSEDQNERLNEDFHKQDSSRNIFSNLNSTSIRKRVQGSKKQPSIDSMFKAYIKKTVGEEICNNQPGKNIDGCDDAEEKNNKCDTDSFSPHYGDNSNDAEEKKDNKCDTDSYFPLYSDDYDSNDAGSFQKKQNENGGKKRNLEEKLNPEKKLGKLEKATPKERRFSKVCDTWFCDKTSEVDSNGHKVNSYLRRVPNDPYKVSCCVCDWSFSVKYKGKSAILDHAKGNRHKESMKVLRGNHQIGTYVEKNVDQSVDDAEIGIARFAASHGISMVVIPHLVKLLKEIFPDRHLPKYGWSLKVKGEVWLNFWAWEN